ncbi:glutathione S-transferase domain-containing protein [Microcoleus sp. F8-D3]
MSIADFYLIPVFTYLSQTPEYEATIAPTSKLRTWWNEIGQLPNVKKVCACHLYTL